MLSPIYNNNILSRIVSILLIIITPLLIILVSYTLAFHDKTGIYIIIGVLGTALLGICIANPKLAFYINLVYVFMSYLIQRMAKTDFPVSIGTEAMIGTMLIGVMVKKIIHHERVWPNLRNPITIIMLTNVIYIGLEAFNPNINSTIGWSVFFRKSIEMLIYYLIVLNLLDNKKDIKFFIKFWIILVFLTAVYAVYEQVVGMFPWDYAWATANPQVYSILFQYGFIRKFSTLSDPPAFGILSASTAVLCICLTLGNYSNKKRSLLIIAAIFMLLGMSYSGTRTATVLVPIGIAFYGMLTIHNKKTIALLAVAIFTVIFILIAPIYSNSVLNRIRSSFHPGKDPSMELRNTNRRHMQPYMHHHPIGGGLGTTGFPGLDNYPNHPLAGFQPDGQFVQNALEIGWIGFGLELLFYFIILKIGARNYYLCKDKDLKNIYAAISATIFCWIISEFSQSGAQAFNIIYIYIPTLVILIKLKDFDNGLIKH